MTVTKKQRKASRGAALKMKGAFKPFKRLTEHAMTEERLQGMGVSKTLAKKILKFAGDNELDLNKSNRWIAVSSTKDFVAQHPTFAKDQADLIRKRLEDETFKGFTHGKTGFFVWLKNALNLPKEKKKNETTN